MHVLQYSFGNVYISNIKSVLSFLSCTLESTKTVQALQYAGDTSVSANKDNEIRGLKDEIEALKKQIAGN